MTRKNCFMLVFYLWVILTVVNSLCRFGPDCLFDCHCEFGQPCDNDTGVCPLGCNTYYTRPLDYPWSGPGCQIGNQAYGGYATQSSVFFTGVPSAGVDGNYDPDFGHGYCTSTNNYTSGAYNWWLLKLNNMTRILEIIIYSRNVRANEMNHFYVRAGNTTFIRNQKVIGYYDDEMPAHENVSFTCPPNTIAQYVSIQQSVNTTGSGILSFCEVVVIGYAYKKCPAGWMTSPGCLEPCPRGRWGVWCAEKCHCEDLTADCDKVNGDCLPGNETAG